MEKDNNVLIAPVDGPELWFTMLEGHIPSFRKTSLAGSQVLLDYLSKGKSGVCKTAGCRVTYFFSGGSSHLPSDWDVLASPLPITGYMLRRSKAPGKASSGLVSLQITPLTFIRATEQGSVQDNMPSLSAGHSNSSPMLCEGFTWFLGQTRFVAAQLGNGTQM